MFPIWIFGHVEYSYYNTVLKLYTYILFQACVDAYLTPCIKRYIDGFQSGFDENLNNVKVLFMQSDGGLTPVER